MLKNKAVILFIIFCFSLACTEQSKTENKSYTDTDLLNRLLTSLNQPQIPIEEHIYIMVPRFGCTGCMQTQLLNLNGILDTNSWNRITYLVSNGNRNVRKSIDINFHVVLDSNGIMDDLDLRLAGIKFIRTEKYLVKENTSFHHDSIIQLKNFFRIPQ